MSSGSFKILLSGPSATDGDVEAVVDALRSGWVAPVGPEITRFEEDLAAAVGVRHAVALSSGTAALHLMLRYVGVGPGDRVIVPTLTFAATAFAVLYLGAEPVFVDVDETMNLDPELLRKAIQDELSQGHRVAALLPVDLYGTPANYEDLMAVAQEFGIPVLEDAAEALGGTHGDVHLGALGMAGAISFNGNKIITSSGGGAIVTANAELADKARYWATQTREPVLWHEHREMGYNYRLSNILAALGRSQLSRLRDEVTRRRLIREAYRVEFEDRTGVHVQTDPPWGYSNAWMTILTLNRTLEPTHPRTIVQQFAEVGIETRQVWMPLHLQPVFAKSVAHLNGRAEEFFNSAICLPSGVGVGTEEVALVSSTLKQFLDSA